METVVIASSPPMLSSSKVPCRSSLPFSGTTVLPALNKEEDGLDDVLSLQKSVEEQLLDTTDQLAETDFEAVDDALGKEKEVAEDETYEDDVLIQESEAPINYDTSVLKSGDEDVAAQHDDYHQEGNYRIDGDDEVISDDSDDTSEDDIETPCCILEFNSSFYPLFCPLPHSPSPVSLNRKEFSKSRTDSDDDVLYLGGSSDDRRVNLFISPLTSFTLALRKSFKIENDLTIEFPALSLSFPECRLHEFSHLSMSKLCDYYSAISKSTQVAPLRILLLEHATSVDRQLRYLEDLYQQARQGIDDIGQPEIARSNSHPCSESAVLEPVTLAVGDLEEEQDYEDPLPPLQSLEPLHAEVTRDDNTIVNSQDAADFELVDYEDDDNGKYDTSSGCKKHPLEEDEADANHSQSTRIEGNKKQRIN